MEGALSGDVIHFKNPDGGYTEVHVVEDLKQGTITIHYITTQPESSKAEEYSINAVTKMLEYARAKGAMRLRASVTTKKIPFWQKIGFVESKDNSNFYEKKP